MKVVHPIKVRPISGEALRYYASSQTDPEVEYIVDLAENQGHGACDCRRWVTTAAPRLKAGEPRFTDRTSCAHVRACWHHWLKTSLHDAAQLINTHEPIHQ
jgi:hypothetical protein